MTTSEIPKQFNHTEQLARDWLTKNNIRWFIFDLDDTLVPTRALFAHQMDRTFDYLSSQIGVDKNQIKVDMETFNNQQFRAKSVSPARWEFVLNDMAQKYPRITKEMRNTALTKLMRIYQIPSQFFPGAEDTLNFLARSGRTICIVTHGNREWKQKQYSWLRLDRFVDTQHYFIVNEDGRKTEKEWAEGLNYFGANPQESAIVGDSALTDILPSDRIGVAHKFWVQDENQWVVLTVPEEQIPAGTIRIPEVGYLVGAMADQSQIITP